MPTIARFVRLDLRSLRTHAAKMILPALIIVVAATLQSHSAYGPAVAGAIVALVTIPTYLFGDDERGRLDTLYGVLGISRRRVVGGRYASGLLLVVVLTAAGLALAPVAAVTLNAPLNWSAALSIAAACAACVAIVLAVELPVYFAVGATHARLAGIAAPALLVLGVFAVARWVSPDATTRLFTWMQTAGSGWLALIALGALVVIAVPSYVVAARLYARRDL